MHPVHGGNIGESGHFDRVRVSKEITDAYRSDDAVDASRWRAADAARSLTSARSGASMAESTYARFRSEEKRSPDGIGYRCFEKKASSSRDGPRGRYIIAIAFSNG